MNSEVTPDVVIYSVACMLKQNGSLGMHQYQAMFVLELEKP